MKKLLFVLPLSFCLASETIQEDDYTMEQYTKDLSEGIENVKKLHAVMQKGCILRLTEWWRKTYPDIPFDGDRSRTSSSGIFNYDGSISLFENDGSPSIFFEDFLDAYIPLEGNEPGVIPCDFGNEELIRKYNELIDCIRPSHEKDLIGGFIPGIFESLHKCHGSSPGSFRLAFNVIYEADYTMEQYKKDLSDCKVALEKLRRVLEKGCYLRLKILWGKEHPGVPLEHPPLFEREGVLSGEFEGFLQKNCPRENEEDLYSYILPDAASDLLGNLILNNTMVCLEWCIKSVPTSTTEN